MVKTKCLYYIELILLSFYYLTTQKLYKMYNIVHYTVAFFILKLTLNKGTYLRIIYINSYYTLIF